MKNTTAHWGGSALLVLALVFTGCQNVSKSKLTIAYEKYTLPNGLEVVLHVDKSDPIVSTAIMYNVGSGREEPGKTGFAHLFEHMLFQESENIAQDQYFKMIQDVGGTLNGFTSNDITTYFEVVPKNALERILWMESDRMGFFINTVTQDAFAIQQNVVQNEKRQGVDNVPYGHTDYIIDKNLYGDGHPYSWQVIGEMADLKMASVDDVKAFYHQYYGPNNATLVVSGDFEKDSVKRLVEKYFGEIKSHGEVTDRKPMPATLKESRRLFHEDNFATVPELTIAWPAPEIFSKDAYALDFLAKILSQGKKAPLYKVLVKEKQLTSEVNCYIYPNDLASRLTLSMRANEGHSLTELEEGINEGMKLFEKEGITQNDLDRIKALMETDFYNSINSIFYKSLQLAYYNTLKGDPGYIEQDIANIKAVTIDDIMRVYNTYLKDKPYVMTSFIPKGQTSLMAANSANAGILEEDINQATQVAIASEAQAASIQKTPSLIDRSKVPPVAADPSLTLPKVWDKKLSNGLILRGIQHDELPLVEFSLVIDGGFFLDDTARTGVANLLTDMMKEGTRNKTPEQLEEAIELLGATIQWYTDMEEITVRASCLSRNFNKTLALVEEMLLEPRWDSVQFELAKIKTINTIEQQEADPNYLASNAMFRLLYGPQHIFSKDILGTKESVAKITLENLKAFYDSNFSPIVSSFNIAGNISPKEVTKALSSLVSRWPAKTVNFPSYTTAQAPEKSTLYFVDVPGAKQSVIYAGHLSLPRTNSEFYDLKVMNFKLGGSFSGILNLILREEKGFTYGARSYFSEMKNPAPFLATTSVRSDATFESVSIYRNVMEKYREGISEEDLNFTRNALIKSNSRRFETIGSLLGMLQSISKYNLPSDYILKEEAVVRNMTADRHKELSSKYINPDHMFYVIAGDAATQLKPLEKIGYGKPIQLN